MSDDLYKLSENESICVNGLVFERKLVDNVMQIVVSDMGDTVSSPADVALSKRFLSSHSNVGDYALSSMELATIDQVLFSNGQ